MNHPGRSNQLQDIWPIPVENTSSEEIPPYALLRVTGAESNANGHKVRKVGKPNGSTGMHLVNGPTAIPQGGFGMATDANTALVAYDTADAPILGDAWGPANNSWLLTKGGEGWETLGGAEDGRVVAGRTSQGSSSYPSYNFQLDGVAKKYDDATCEVKLLDDTMAPVGDPITVYDPHKQYSSGGRTDAKGRCTLVRDADTGMSRLEITHLENIAMLITGTLAEDMGETTANAAESTDATAWGPSSFERATAPGTVLIWGHEKLVGGMRKGEAYVALREDLDTTPPTYRLLMRDGSEINVQLAGNKFKSDGSRTCYVCEDDLSATSVIVTVYDPHLTYEGAGGQYGVASFKRDEETQLHRLEFTHINQFAEYVSGNLVSDMTEGSANASVADFWGGHHEGLTPGSTVTVVPGLSCHEDLKEGDSILAARYNSITPTYRILSACDTSTPEINFGCGIEYNVFEDHYQIDPTIACDGLYWDQEQCCLSVNIPENGYLYINGGGELDLDAEEFDVVVPPIECSLGIEGGELKLTITWNERKALGPAMEEDQDESECSIEVDENCNAI